MELMRETQSKFGGALPLGWTVKPLGAEVAQLDAGVSVRSVDENQRGVSHEKMVLKTSAVVNGIFLKSEAKTILPIDLSRAKLNLRAESIVISRMNTPDLVGECGYIDRDYPDLYLPDRLWMTKLRAGSDISSSWLAYLLSSSPYRKAIKELATGTSGSMKNIAKSALLALDITYPPAKEQRAIATALSDVDDLLAKLDQLIAKKSDIKKGAMQELLTGKRRLPGFSGEWTATKLGEVASFQKGKGLSKAELEHGGETRCIHYGELFTSYRAKIDQVHSSAESFEGALLSKRNDVLMPTSDVTPRGLATASCLMEEGVILGGDILIIRAFPNTVDGAFLAYCIRFFKKQVMQLVSGSTVYHIYPSGMAKFELLMPTYEEQIKISAILNDMEQEITELKSKRTKLAAIKQGMMQQLLTGKIRLV